MQRAAGHRARRGSLRQLQAGGDKGVESCGETRTGTEVRVCVAWLVQSSQRAGGGDRPS